VHVCAICDVELRKADETAAPHLRTPQAACPHISIYWFSTFQAIKSLSICFVILYKQYAGDLLALACHCLHIRRTGLETTRLSSRWVKCWWYWFWVVHTKPNGRKRLPRPQLQTKQTGLVVGSLDKDADTHKSASSWWKMSKQTKSQHALSGWLKLKEN